MDQLVLTANPDFADLALRELQEAGFQITESQLLASGVYLIEIDGSFWELAEKWRQSRPMFVHHICPVQVTVQLSGEETDIERIRQALLDEIVPFVDPEPPFSVQTRILADLPYKRFTLNNTLSETIQVETSAALDVRAPAQVVSVICAEIPSPDVSDSTTVLTPTVVALLGISPTVYNLSDWAGGMRRYAREAERISRSEFKLLEALELFDISLPARGVALDLGAAPGGWTRILRLQQQYVTAVDPGDLADAVAVDSGVRHIRSTAEEYLKSEPDTYDLIVNDIRIDARDSARLMVAYSRYLYDDGFALLTLKLPEQQRERVIDHALNILRRAYIVADARQLFHNRSEVTVYLRPAR